jgi:hypothetical protein
MFILQKISLNKQYVKRSEENKDYLFPEVTKNTLHV